MTAVARTRTGVLALALAALAVPGAARAGLRVEGASVRGGEGYVQRSLDATLKFAPKIEWDDPDAPWPFTAFWVRVQRSGTDRNGLKGPVYTSLGEAGVDILKRSGFSVRYFRTPAPSESLFAYRARGWAISTTAGWEGWWPQPDVGGKLPRVGRNVETALTFDYGRTHHEELLRISTMPVQWAVLRETDAGATLSQTYFKDTTVRVFGEVHNYDRGLRALAQRLEFFALRDTQAAVPRELLEGFLRRAWGAGAGQFLGEHVELDGDWRRVTYEAGLVEGADTLTGRVTVFVGLYFSAHALYEVFQPEGGGNSKYRGFGVALSF